MRRRTIAITTLALAVQALAPVSPARAADPVTVPFAFTGAEQSWVVPVGVTSIHVVAVGGAGGKREASPGGRGARVEGGLEVAAGTTLFVEVGGNGGDVAAGQVQGGPGGFNGGGAGGTNTFSTLAAGGGGGGASDLRTVARSDSSSPASRLVVAGGGGGGVAGGDAGASGGGEFGAGGMPGTATTGGAGGVGNVAGQNGSAGTGGNGGGYNLSGGGGGGGLFGGGGGAGMLSTLGGGGGGGSNYTGNATGTSITIDSGGVPSISITYVPASGSSGPGTVDAVVTMADSAVCLELSTAAIDFGTRQFGEVGAAAAPLIGVTNCSAVGESILVRGTDATGPGGAAWSLVTFGACQTGVLGTDKFRLRLASQAVPDLFVDFGTENVTLQALVAGATANHEAQIDTPCPGSTGAGAVMSMQVVFTATEEAAP